jgi:hypothetical protein
MEKQRNNTEQKIEEKSKKITKQQKMTSDFLID